MSVTYSGLSSGSALFARGNSFKDRGASFCINFDQQPFEKKKNKNKRLFCACGHPSKMEEVKINCSR